MYVLSETTIKCAGQWRARLLRNMNTYISIANLGGKNRALDSLIGRVLEPVNLTMPVINRRDLLSFNRNLSNHHAAFSFFSVPCAISALDPPKNAIARPRLEVSQYQKAQRMKNDPSM